MFMKIENTKEIHIEYDEGEVNKLLNSGWTLYKVLQSGKINDSLQPCFILLK